MLDDYKYGKTLKLTLFSYFNENKIKPQSAISAFFWTSSTRAREGDIAGDSTVEINDPKQASTSSNVVSESVATATHPATNLMIIVPQIFLCRLTAILYHLYSAIYSTVV